MQRIGIAGAGLMGRLLAWQLNHLGHHITLFDTDGSGQSSAGFAAAGMLTPFTESTVSQDIVLTLGIESLALWPHLLQRISPDIHFSQQGSIIACHQNDASDLVNFIQQLSDKIDRHLIQPLDTAALRELEPELQFDQGYLLKHEGFLDSRQLLNTLQTYIHDSSITFIHSTVKYVIAHAIFTDEQRHNFDFVFDCRGRGGEQHFPDLRSVRGEIIRVYAPDVTINRMIRLTHPRYPLYIVPTADKHYIIGATEIESEDDSPISVRSCVELLNAAYSIHSGFAEARIVETRSALRPALIDNSPRIVFEEGLIAINGLYRHGFLIAPALLQECIKLFRSGADDHLHPNLIQERAYAH